MCPTNFAELGWLHDSIVHSIEYDASGAAGRDVRISITCPRDIEYTQWAGKDLLLVARDVLAMKHLVWSTEGVESINAIQTDLSIDTREQLRLSERGNSRFSGLTVAVIFHSGSSLEMICNDFTVEIRE